LRASEAPTPVAMRETPETFSVIAERAKPVENKLERESKSGINVRCCG